MSTIANSPETTTTTRTSSGLFSLRTLSIVIAIVYLMISGYLTVQKLQGNMPPCSNTGPVNCSVVLSSAWSNILGFPTSGWGFGLHVIILSLILLEPRVKVLREYGPMILWGVIFFGFVYHCYLTFYVSMFTLRSLCPWCLTAHTLMTIHLIIASIKLWRYFRTPVPTAA